MRINREVVESYLGEKVEIKLFDGEKIVGKLHKTGEEQYPEKVKGERAAQKREKTEVRWGKNPKKENCNIFVNKFPAAFF